MKLPKILAIKLLFLISLTTLNAQVNLDFNTQNLPEEWTTQGSFEIQNAGIYPICNENAFVGSFFETNSEFWIQTNAYNYNGGNIAINMSFGIKDLYHALEINTSFQKPIITLEYAEGDSQNWIEHSQFPLDYIQESTACINFNTVINASELEGFTTLKYRFVYYSPEQTGMLYLLYWSIDNLQINEQQPIEFPCIDNLGGGLEPSFVTFKINGTAFDHNTYSEPTEYYHQYPQTTTLIAGQSYDFYTFTSSEAVVAIWMDYNQNNIFEESEYVELINSFDTQNTTSFTVSNTSNTGQVKMRVRSRAYYSSINPNDACTSFGSGETRDYVFTITNNLGTEDPHTSSKTISIYPNPTADFINIQSQTAVRNVAVYNMMGQMVLNSSSEKIDVSNLFAGTFIVEVTLVDGIKNVRKVVKK